MLRTAPYHHRHGADRELVGLVVGRAGAAQVIRRRVVIAALVTALSIVAAAVQVPASAAPMAAAVDAGASRPAWKHRLDDLISDRTMGVSVRLHGATLYRHASGRDRVPASNQKLLLTMALLNELSPSARMKTRAAAARVRGGTVRGDLWLIGRGDPTLTAGGQYGRDLPFRATGAGALARKLKAAGVTRITGSVVGARTYYARDWWAPGWGWDYPARYVPLAAGLSFEGNFRDGKHVRTPERLAARALTRKLRGLGIVVADSPRVGTPPHELRTLAGVRSVRLRRMLQFMNRRSSNFFAEMFGKRLAVATGTRPGSIAAGAAAVTTWARGQGLGVTARDASGLSRDNRVSPDTLTALLDGQPLARRRMLRSTLAAGGQGTLKDRLHGARVRAKTGTLPEVSALSGYVYLERRQAWASFSILSRGMLKSTAADLEDRIVRLLLQRAR